MDKTNNVRTISYLKPTTYQVQNLKYWIVKQKNVFLPP